MNSKLEMATKGVFALVLLLTSCWCSLGESESSKSENPPCEPKVFDGTPFSQFVTKKECGVDENLLKLFRDDDSFKSMVNKTAANVMCIGFIEVFNMASEDSCSYDSLAHIPSEDFCKDSDLIGKLKLANNSDVFDGHDKVTEVANFILKFCNYMCNDTIGSNELCWAFGEYVKVVMKHHTTTTTATQPPTTQPTSTSKPTPDFTSMFDDGGGHIGNSGGVDEGDDKDDHEQGKNSDTNVDNDDEGKVASDKGTTELHAEIPIDVAPLPSSNDSHTPPLIDGGDQGLSTDDPDLSTDSTGQPIADNTSTDSLDGGDNDISLSTPAEEQPSSSQQPSGSTNHPTISHNQIGDNETGDESSGDHLTTDPDGDDSHFSKTESDHTDNSNDHTDQGTNNDQHTGQANDIDQHTGQGNNNDQYTSQNNVENSQDSKHADVDYEYDDDDGYSYWHFAAVLLFILFLGVGIYLASLNRKKVCLCVVL